MSESATSITPLKGKPNLLCTFQELPTWAQDNIYIHTGYRIPTESYKLCFNSLFYLHNETGNIYSHLVGCAVFLILGFISWQYIFASASALWFDYAVVYTFIATAIICLGCSSFFHLVSCHSETVSHSWNRCDFAGIVFLIVYELFYFYLAITLGFFSGSFFPVIYYGFFCEKTLKMVYLSIIVFLGFITLGFTISKKYSTSKFRIHRTVLFLGLGLSGLVPVAHFIIKEGVGQLGKAEILYWFLSMALLYIFGATIYGLRIPERWYPGRFDYWFHSHQIFHIFVVTAAVFHYVGVIKAYQYAHSEDRECPLLP